MSSINVTTQKRNVANYRFGQDFDYDKVRFQWRRTPYANRLVVGVVADAIGKKFNVIDTETGEPVENNEEIKDIIETMWLDILKTIHFQRAYGKSLGMFFTVDGMDVPIFRAYDMRHYFVEYDEFGFPIKYNITNNVGGVMAISTGRDVVDDELDFTYELLIDEEEAKGEGLSVLESVWDTLFSLMQLDENGTYYAIRYGAGIRYLKIPQEKLSNSAYMSNLNSFLSGAIGVNGVFSLPYTVSTGGTKMETEIVNENAVQIKFLEIRDLLIGSLSAQTGIPREIFLGSEIGLRSSEKNEDRYFDYLQSIQDDYKPFFKWIVSTLNTKFEWFSEDLLIDIDYVGRDTLSDEESMAVLATKIDIANKAGFNVPIDWLASMLDIPLEEKEIDPLGINGATDADVDDEEDEIEEVVDEDEEDLNTNDDIDNIDDE